MQLLDYVLSEVLALPGLSLRGYAPPALTRAPAPAAVTAAG